MIGKRGPFTGVGRRKAEHGTNSGYQAHVIYGTPPCDECREAARAYQREWRARHGRQPLNDAEPDDLIERLFAEFTRLLTTDSPHKDRRRRDFNQAVFMADGKPIWTETTLDMITGKFEKAVRNLERGGMRGKSSSDKGGNDDA